jgi:hypothetical protein
LHARSTEVFHRILVVKLHFPTRSRAFSLSFLLFAYALGKVRSFILPDKLLDILPFQQNQTN